MAAKMNKTSELTDIPLSLQQSENPEMNTSKPQKLKSNSLKRFFRVARPSLQANTSAETEDHVQDKIKNSRSFQMRFGTFGKKGDTDSEPEELQASSSMNDQALAKYSGSKLNLQERFSNYWSTVFRKSSKKTPKTSSSSDVQSQDVGTGTTEVNQIEYVHSDNL